MVSEDGAHYEGEFKAAGVLYGKGKMTFRSGDVLEGHLDGSWNEGVKVNATMHLNGSGSDSPVSPVPKYVFISIDTTVRV